MTEAQLSGVPDICQEHLTAIDGLASAIDAMNEVILVAGPLERIELWRALTERIDEGLDDAVAGARMRGDSWGTIGRAAGMTRQAAHGRWAKALDPADTGQPGDQELKAPTAPVAKEGRRVRPGDPKREVVGVRLQGLPFGVAFDVTRRRLDERPGPVDGAPRRRCRPRAGHWQPVAASADSTTVSPSTRASRRVRHLESTSPDPGETERPSTSDTGSSNPLAVRDRT